MTERTEHETKRLVDLVRMATFSTPTPRLKADGSLDRFDIAIPAEAYLEMKRLAWIGPGWRPSEKDRMEILMHFERKARGVGDGVYELKGWSEGDLEQAEEDTRDVPQLAVFHNAIQAEMVRRATLIA